ncbi:dihydrofolate reductase ['Camptotheca acuminata' phytoplasma]|uniref:dihydrofolate reductase n=1 Tax='Camptotheca acuminata' phytoplasma TaxID=3239192 RepID=UPI00351A33F7
MITIIAALDSNFLIGKENKLPWHYPKDLLFFKQKTFNKNVLMGINTYQSLKTYYKKKPLPFDKIYVASRSKLNIQDIFWVSDLKIFLEEYKNKKEEIMVIGGSQIYHQSLDYAKKMYLTHILKRYKGDTFFPFFNYQYYLVKEKTYINELIFVTYIKK